MDFAVLLPNMLFKAFNGARPPKISSTHPKIQVVITAYTSVGHTEKLGA